jgi:hypothetical protein
MTDHKARFPNSNTHAYAFDLDGIGIPGGEAGSEALYWMAFYAYEDNNNREPEILHFEIDEWTDNYASVTIVVKAWREVNEWDIVTLAEMIAGLKTVSAPKFAIARSAGTGITPAEMIDSAIDLLKADYFANNHGAADRLGQQAKGRLEP